MPRHLPQDCTLIGLDGGASGVRAWEVVARPGDLFTLGRASCERGYSGRDSGGAVRACAEALAEVARAVARPRVLFGLGMPGRKTADGRGIGAARHGPVAPDFLDELEREVGELGVELLGPCQRLDDDGFLCGVGEDVAPDGAFLGVGDAYYVGGGSGVAECLKLGGRVLALDEIGGGIRRAHELWAGDGGASFEERISVAAFNRRFARRAGGDGHPERRAEAGDPVALELFAEVAADLARLVRRRIELLGNFQRVVLGQRLALLLDRPALRGLVARAWVDRGLDPECVVLSGLRAAPAIGAAALAHARALGAPDG